MKTKLKIAILTLAFAMCAALLPQIPIMSGSIEVYNEEGKKLSNGEATDALMKEGGNMEVSFEWRLAPKREKKADTSKKKNKSKRESTKHAEKCVGVRDRNPDGEWGGGFQYPDHVPGDLRETGGGEFTYSCIR